MCMKAWANRRLCTLTASKPVDTLQAESVPGAASIKPEAAIVGKQLEGRHGYACQVIPHCWYLAAQAGRTEAKLRFGADPAVGLPCQAGALPRAHSFAQARAVRGSYGRTTLRA